MNMLKKYRFVYVILAAAFLLSACLPAEGTDGSTINATQAAELIETAVAQALNAQATQNAAAVPQATATLVPTNTPQALPTHTLVPTITPLVRAPTAAVASSGGGGSSGGSGGTTYVPLKEDCNAYIGKRPYDNTEMRTGDPFDIKFTIENTGTETWPAGYDLIHSYGPDFTNGQFPAFIQLPEMKPGAQFSVGPYDATAPAEKGRQVMEFKLQGGFCWPVIVINVK